MNLHYYQSKAGKNLIFEYIDSLPTEKKDKKIVEMRAKELGNELGKAFI